MTPKRRRLVFVAFGAAVLAVAVGLVLVAFEDNLVFFFSPTEVVEKGVKPGQRFRIGGLVLKGSLEKTDVTVRFGLTDTKSTVPVLYSGVLPDLFREEQGVVAEGVLDGQGVFVAEKLLAKHDENYMPPEVVDSLKKSGVWQHNE